MSRGWPNILNNSTNGKLMRLNTIFF